MSKDCNLYLDDILDAIRRVRAYTTSMDYTTFAKNTMVSDAVIRNLLIIGEASKRIPENYRKKHSEIEWKKLAGLRDILVHEYAGIELEIVWDVVVNKLPLLEIAITKLRETP